ncbi:hypothetical protein M3T53_02985 [Actinomyces sp. B33]|uniref:hypothetical protein n=1 Tax=Actinomyces sp. B33 TaxID=2942131 RepID=UPI0023421E78|nr:hypothetical protein [Actinomyces sp. B33]MDC4232681.1 hypothetical protein [Actinomyces sp. B33]
MDMDLFLADLASRFDAGRREEMDGLVGELADAERASVDLGSRIRGGRGGPLTVVVRGGRSVRGRVLDAADSWVLIREDAGDRLIPVSAVSAVWPLATAAPGEGVIARRLGIGHVLRALADRRSPVVVDHDAGRHCGVISAVYADHLEIEASVDAGSLDSRDRDARTLIGLTLSGVRCIGVVRDRWGS